ncbi:receptor-type tyrosine-protein phosphatase C isoform X2 [Salarias fasciatus]|uniref:receptor-type tyrosine-protein phosphatase C isoform X2 n=1 Tax=Salarias fasciatus TaxID=181472 RepID=UPI001176B51C|nr:receptor-type tyrosine-protein phosphatase C isoform X2 [Salarias fasciatus]
MAGLRGLKVLLLWTGIIGLASCQSTTGTSPATVNAPLPTTTAAPSANNDQTNQSPDPKTSTVDQPSTTNGTTVKATETSTATEPSPAPTECSFKVNPVRFGLSIEMINGTTANYTVRITEEEGSTESHTVHFSDQNSTRSFKDLKPCAKYDVSVTFMDSAGNERLCNSTVNVTETDSMNAADISRGSCMPGWVCYQSGWDLSASLSTPKKKATKLCENGICFKPALEDICSEFTTTFEHVGSCGNSSDRREDITVDFLNSSEIRQKFIPGLPAQIDTVLPSKCVNLSVDYTCSEPNKANETKKLSELKPFTNYTCTGLIKNNNNSLNKTTPPVPALISCHFRLNKQEPDVTNTSIRLSWETFSPNCESIVPDLSYECSCQRSGSKDLPEEGKAGKRPDGGSCLIRGLSAFTDYSCVVSTSYMGEIRYWEPQPERKTKPGTPGPVTDLKVTIIDHNVMKVTCKPPYDGFKGREQIYKARLSNGVKKDKMASCEFEFRDLSYLTEYTVEVTASNGVLESHPRTDKRSTRYNDKAVIGFLVFLITVTFLALLFVVYKIYILKRRRTHDMNENIRLISPANDEESLMSVEPIAAGVLLETYKRKYADEGRLFLAEFQSIPRIFSRYTMKEAKKSSNAFKNRYVDILPYDYNRVQLMTGNGEAGCDYINASFIDGYNEPKKYIAAQGPKEETIGDFWRMIWEQQSSIIVMVTRCEEGNRIKCAQYWPSPDRETEIYEEFVVKLNSVDRYPDYIIRRLSLINKREKNTEREVTHIQFMSWPDHGVPGEPHLLLKLRRRVNAFKNFFSGPIVVHCSAGVGRTGTYISIDAMMEGLEAEGRVDIYGYVVRLRKQRCLMVQVEPQYILIHQALLEHNQFGETETPLSELHSTLSTLNQNSSDDGSTLMEEEFKRLPDFKNWRTFNAGITEENKKKNRSSDVIPYDYNRVLIKLNEGCSQDSEPDEDDEEESSDEENEDATKYINASHIDGYWGPRAFIVAQTPLADTMADFWMMVHQKKVSTIVMLSEQSDGEKESVYWGDDKKTFGEIEVELKSTDTSSTYITRKMMIHHVKRKESRPVNHYQFLKWEDGKLPEKSQDLTDMIKNIKVNSGIKSSQRITPILVHCNNGSLRSGIFCALWNLLDSAETEKLVDVFQVIKTLRKERQGMLLSLEHYQFLYKALEDVFPHVNGEVKPVQASAVDSVQLVSETKTAAEQPAGTASPDQQVAAAESPPVVVDGEKEDKGEEPEEVSSAVQEKKSAGEASNGPTVTVEV